MEYDNIKLGIDRNIATIRLNRPDAMNALSRELVADLSGALKEVAADEAVKALVLRGEGAAFAPGPTLSISRTPFKRPRRCGNICRKSMERCFNWRPCRCR